MIFKRYPNLIDEEKAGYMFYTIVPLTWTFNIHNCASCVGRVF